jgi:HlyD family secretion protein
VSRRLWRRPALAGGLAVAAALVVVLGVRGQRLTPSAPTSSTTSVDASAPAGRAVAALGRLEPSGDVRRLAAPISGIGGSPRITALLVQEGDRVRAGQLLVRFDTGPALQAQARLLDTRIANLRSRVALQTRDINRYRQLGSTGVVPSADLDSRETDLLALQGQLQEAIAERTKIQRDLELTELRAPIDGQVLRLHARVGERPGDKGVLELGNSDQMQALIEVYESDIDRVRLGQPVTLSSENGGFSGSMRGQVVRISPQVRQREVLSTDPTGDADARIVEVRVALDAADARRVRELTGLKVIARLAG